MYSKAELKCNGLSKGSCPPSQILGVSAYFKTQLIYGTLRALLYEQSEDTASRGLHPAVVLRGNRCLGKLQQNVKLHSIIFLLFKRNSISLRSKRTQSIVIIKSFHQTLITSSQASKTHLSLEPLFLIFYVGEVCILIGAINGTLSVF